MSFKNNFYYDSENSSIFNAIAKQKDHIIIMEKLLFKVIVKNVPTIKVNNK